MKPLCYNCWGLGFGFVSPEPHLGDALVVVGKKEKSFYVTLVGATLLMPISYPGYSIRRKKKS